MKSYKRLLKQELERRGYKVSYHETLYDNDSIVIDQKIYNKFKEWANKPRYKIIEVIIYTHGKMSKFDMQETAERIKEQCELDMYHQVDIYVY